MTPKVSVVVPTYRRAASVARLLDHLDRQAFQDFEVLLVDQNPPGFLAETLERPGSRVQQISLPEPNASTARNRGFLEAGGDLILFLDDDLSPPVDFLARAIRVIEEQPEVGCLAAITYGAMGIAGSIANLETIATGDVITGTDLFEIEYARSDALFFRRDYFRRSGGFDQVLFCFARTAEDQELCLRMRRRGQRIWASRSLLVPHDDFVEGGCELRTSPYWEVQARCIRSWAFRYRAHRGRGGRLAMTDGLRILYSAALNRKALLAGPRHVARQLKLVSEALIESRAQIEAHLPRYMDVRTIDHLRSAPT